MDEAGASACCWFSLILGLPSLIALIVFSVQISQTYMPECSIQDLYIPALNTQFPYFNSSTTTATFIFFDIELKNMMEEVGLRYNNINLTFYYGANPIAYYAVSGFYQGHKKTAHQRDLVETKGMPWWEAFATVSNGSTVTFMVELSAVVKMKRAFWYSGGKKLVLGSDVEVNGSGEKVQKKGVKLVERKQTMNDALAPAGADQFDLRTVDSDAKNVLTHSAA